MSSNSPENRYGIPGYSEDELQEIILEEYRRIAAENGGMQPELIEEGPSPVAYRAPLDAIRLVGGLERRGVTLPPEHDPVYAWHVYMDYKMSDY